MSTAGKVRYPFDIVEKSPSGNSKCGLCLESIKKGDWRIVRVSKRSNPSHFYHKSCLMTHKSTKARDFLATFNLSHSPRHRSKSFRPSHARFLISRETSRVEHLLMERERLMASRGLLRKMLIQSRREFAKQEGRPDSSIFSDSILDHLVEIMPSSEAELLNIRGIGVKKLSRYGSMILSTINCYKQGQYEGATKANNGRNETQNQSNNKGPRNESPEVIVLSSDDESEGPPSLIVRRRYETANIQDIDSHDGEVILEKEITIDEIVEKRIRDAEEKGEVIVL